MLSEPARQRTIAALHRLYAGGGYGAVPDGPAQPAATLSVLRALDLLGTRTPVPDSVAAFTDEGFEPAVGAWCAPDTGRPAVLPTAAGLLTLRAVGALDTLAARLPAALRWMAEHAGLREEHFMTLAVVDECQAGPPPDRCVRYFLDQRRPDGTFGPSVLNNAIAASALARVGAPVEGAEAVTRLMLAGQTAAGGFTDGGAEPQLWTTYCVMRAMDLLAAAPAGVAWTAGALGLATPDADRIGDWVLTLRLDEGGFGTAGTLSADATYQCLSVLDWIAAPVIDAARRGDTDALKRYLRSGGDPDRNDPRGWTPLAAAAVRGKAQAVQALLSGAPGGKPADPDKRVADADALPLFWAGQAGDVDTAAAILRHRPEQMFATSAVNGHTVLLQAVFFGTQRHRDLVAWLLGHAGEILGSAPDDSAARAGARRRLLTACNVRGYSATAMARLWHNEPLAALLSSVDDTTEQERAAYYAALLAAIAVPEPAEEPARAAQHQTDALIVTIEHGFEALNAAATGPNGDLDAAEAALLSAVTAALSAPGFEIDRAGGPLTQTPVIVAVTGDDADERVAQARARLVSLLLGRGADPDLPERHPMAVDAVIRAAVLNHFECLQEIGRHMPPLAFAAALNERPAINGQTALHDSVHRALTAPDATLDRHLDQITWMIRHGARLDIADFTGVTVADRARRALDDDIMRPRAAAVLAAAGLSPTAPAVAEVAAAVPAGG